jgi:hypothetical protein
MSFQKQPRWLIFCLIWPPWRNIIGENALNMGWAVINPL